MSLTNETNAIRKAYTARDLAHSRDDYGYQWHARNPVSYTYRQARERAIIKLLNRCQLRLEESALLDIGCGAGDFLRFAASLGAPPEQIYGVDLMADRVEEANRLCPPGVHVSVEEAHRLPFADATFDCVTQFTVFSSILSTDLQKAVAREMDRVLKPGGWLLWYDMKNRYPDSAHIQGISKNELHQLFNGYGWLAQQQLHYRWLARLARRSWLLCELVEYLPGLPHTHLLAVLQKP
jgi:ubiquinone/menaquinone biosynthesis C-methylase UbiE